MMREEKIARELAMDQEKALSLYTFYEGRVQTTKSILVGILTWILSLQIPLLSSYVVGKQSSTSIDAFSLIALFFLSLFVFISMKGHMDVNDRKSKHFQTFIEAIDYNPKIKSSNWIYKAAACFPLGLEWVLFVFTLGVTGVGILFII
jgi:hypothetical protein